MSTTPEGKRLAPWVSPNSYPPYCLMCEKEGHRTNECHSTYMVNARSNEIDRLAATPSALSAAPEEIEAVAWCMQDMRERVPGISDAPRKVTWLHPRLLWPEGIPGHMRIVPYFAAPQSPAPEAALADAGDWAARTRRAQRRW